MATLNATNPTLKSDDPTSESSKPGDPKPEDPKPEDPKPEDPKLEDPNIEQIKSEEIKPQEGKGQGLHTITQPIILDPPITVKSADWQTTLEALLRLPGMVSDHEMNLFRTGNPIGEIAFALGVTDSAYTITESSWVPVAERVFEIQKRCLIHARNIEYYIAADGWNTEEITAEWCARVLQDLQRKGFSTACTAVVAFVARVYLRTRSWKRFGGAKGQYRHKRVIDALKPDPSAQLIERCSKMAKTFTNIVNNSRRAAVEGPEEQNSHRESPSDSEHGTSKQRKSSAIGRHRSVSMPIL